MKFLVRIFLVLVAAATVAPRVRAQASPKQNASVYLGVHAKIRAASDYGIRFQSSVAGENDPYYAWHTNWAGLSTAVESPNILAKLVPGRLYTFSLGSASMREADVQFNVPAGYTLYVGQPYLERTPRTTFVTTDYNGSTGTYMVWLELRPNDGVAALPAGFALAPQVSDVIWAVSLGLNQSGGSAGALRWRSASVSEDLLDVSSLVFAEPDGADIFTYPYTDGAPKYFGSAQAQIYVRRNSGTNTGYVIEVYDPLVTYSYANNDPDNDWSFDSSPYITYTISNPDASWQGRVRITRLQESKTETWTLGTNNGTTTIEQTNNLRKITVVSTTQTLSADPYPGDSASTNYRRERITVTDGNGANLASRVDRYYRNFAWNEELIREVADPSLTSTENNGTPYTGANLTTKYIYETSGWTNGAFTGNVTKLKSVVRADGSWEAYNYYDDFAHWGQLKTVTRPWQDGPSDPANATASTSRITTYTYSGERGVYQELLTGTEETAPSGSPGTATTIAKTSIPSLSIANNTDYIVYPNQIQQLRTETVRTYTDSAYLTTTRKVFHWNAVADFRDKVYSQTNPDGTQISGFFARGDYTCYLSALTNAWDATYFTVNASGGFFQESYFRGTSADPGGGATQVTSWLGKYIEPVWLTPYRSTRQDIVRRLDGGVVYEVTYLYTGSGNYKIIAWSQTDFTQGQWYARADSTGAHVGRSFIAGRVNYETRADGTQTQYFFDALFRVDYQELKGVAATSGFPAQSTITTSYTYDAAGRVKTTSTTGGGPTLTTASNYDKAGRLTDTTDTRGLQTTYTYPTPRSITVTLPGGATKTTETYLDGSPKSVTGTAVVAEYYANTVNSNGTLLQQTTLASASGPRWTKVTTDLAGRTLTEEKPAYSGASPSTFIRQYSYYLSGERSSGKLKKVTEPGIAPTYYRYDNLAELEYTWLDVDGSSASESEPQPGLASSDRVTRIRSQVMEESGVFWLQKQTYAYNQTSSSTALLQGETRQRLVPYAGSDWQAGNIVQVTRSFDVFGNQTDQTTNINRATRLTTMTTNLPDSSVDSVVTTLNGRKVQETTAQNLTYNNYYDSLGRLVKQTDPRTDSSSTARIGYYDSTTGYIGQVAWREDNAGNRTNYHYDGSTGRLSASVDPAGKATRYAYNKRGDVIRVWGAAALPVEYSYNEYGERTDQRTFQTLITVDDFSTSTWPRSDSGDDSTTGTPNPASWTTSTSSKTHWTYEAASGVLTAKTDAATHSVNYTYNARGQMKTRTWARGGVTTYGYDGQTAELLSIDYPAGTTDIAGEYNRLGQLKQVDDDTGRRYLEHCACGKITQETFAPGFYGSRVLNYNLEGTTAGALGRTKGITLSIGTTAEQDYAYGFDTYGRLNAVSIVGTTTAYGYSFTAGSNLISAIADSTSGWTQTRTYLPNRDLLDVIETKFGTATKARFEYDPANDGSGYDSLGRRKHVVETGEMFDRYQGGGEVVKWGYNDRSEVTSAQYYHGTSVTTPGSLMGLRNFSFTFDNIGNRVTSAQDSATGTMGYANNGLNQIKDRTTPGYATVSGLAPGSATVTYTVNGGSSQSTTRQGDYFYGAATAGNSSSAMWLTTTVSSSFGSSDGSGSITGNAFLSKATLPTTGEKWVYDDDGNLTQDDRWSYTWDAENRLIKVESRSDLVGASNVIPPAKARQITFIYDYMGRRVRKTVKSGSGYATVVSDTKYLYDGWNLLAEYDAAASNAKVRGYMWGLDWSGSKQGAGGVGGLLMIRDFSTSQNYQPAYDGNGNLVALTNRTGGALAAAYEYGPFGEPLRATGAYAANNPFRFSTKVTDDETGLVYYGYRYYDSATGRFLGRDPMGESGGVNLYAFVGNNTANNLDYLGLRCRVVIKSYGTVCQNKFKNGAWVLDCRINYDDPTYGVDCDGSGGGGGGNGGNGGTGGGSAGGGPTGDKPPESPPKPEPPKEDPPKEDPPAPPDSPKKPSPERCAELSKLYGQYLGAGSGGFYDAREDAQRAMIINAALGQREGWEYSANVIDAQALASRNGVPNSGPRYFATPAFSNWMIGLPQTLASGTPTVSPHRDPWFIEALGSAGIMHRPDGTPTIGFPNSVITDSIHTHPPPGGEGFSGNDQVFYGDYSQGNGMTGYVVEPSYKVRSTTGYNAKTKIVTLIPPQDLQDLKECFGNGRP